MDGCERTCLLYDYCKVLKRSQGLRLVRNLSHDRRPLELSNDVLRILHCQPSGRGREGALGLPMVFTVSVADVHDRMPLLSNETFCGNSELGREENDGSHSVLSECEVRDGEQACFCFYGKCVCRTEAEAIRPGLPAPAIAETRCRASTSRVVGWAWTTTTTPSTPSSQRTRSEYSYTACIWV